MFFNIFYNLTKQTKQIVMNVIIFYDDLLNNINITNVFIILQHYLY
jgi:hypothetical protein